MLKKQTKLWRTLMLSTWFTISHHRTAEPPARHSAVKSYQNQGFSQTETHQQLKKPKVTQFTSATPVLNSPFIPSAAVQEALLVHLAGSHKHFLHNAPATFLTMAHQPSDKRYARLCWKSIREKTLLVKDTDVP